MKNKTSPKFFVILFFTLFFLLSFFVSGKIDSQDGFQYLAVARNIYYKGEPTAPEYGYTGGVGVGKNIHLSTHVGKNGKTYSLTGLGFSLAMLPAVATTDIVYKLYGLSPKENFPLESDWLIFLTTSFTNAFFAAGIGVLLFAYLNEMKVGKKHALAAVLLGLLTTNLFVLSKHIFAHTIFTFFFLLSFLLLKKAIEKEKRHLLFISGISLGIVTISYNTSFLLVIIPYLVYFLLLNRSHKQTNLRKIASQLLLLVLGYVPLFAIHVWYQNLISVSQTALVQDVVNNSFSVPVGILLEGLWGQLFSPGRSFFLYSPILLIPLVFWFKLDKKAKPEIVVSILVFFIYVSAAALAWSQNSQGTGDSLWHGESSWGPRYLTATIPFGIIILGYLLPKLKIKEWILTVVPLALVGIYVQFLGVLMPYQIKFHNLDLEFQINSINYPMYLYTNLLPRFSPLVNQSKNLVRLVNGFPKTLDNGIYNVRFYDGIDFAFNVGPERWRMVDQKGYILFDNQKRVQSLEIVLINHPIAETKQSAEVNMFLNSKLKVTEILKIGEKKTITVNLLAEELNDKDNLLIIEADLPDYETYFNKKHFLAITQMKINDTLVNLESIDVPYMSDLGPILTNSNYTNWGKTNNSPWLSWHIHTQVYERTPDLWYLTPLYYWDIPKKPFLVMFLLNLIALIYLAKKTLSAVFKT